MGGKEYEPVVFPSETHLCQEPEVAQAKSREKQEMTPVERRRTQRAGVSPSRLFRGCSSLEAGGAGHGAPRQGHNKVPHQPTGNFPNHKQLNEQGASQTALLPPFQKVLERPPFPYSAGTELEARPEALLPGQPSIKLVASGDGSLVVGAGADPRAFSVSRAGLPLLPYSGRAGATELSTALSSPVIKHFGHP